jgi:hypothetical protein
MGVRAVGLRAVPRLRWSVRILAIVVGSTLLACTGDEPDPAANAVTASSTPPPVSTVSEAVDVSPTPPALPDEPPATSGPIAADCVNGWKTPKAGSGRFTSPLGVIRRATGVRGELVVVDMRFFEGPESPPSDKGYLLNVQRWYVKLYAANDLSFQGRFLVEARTFGQGLAAVAPYDTSGYRSPDWIGFQFDSGDPEPKRYEGLPGEWSGIPYDFVEGGAGLEIPGLPDEVVGCLSAS